MYVDTAGSTTHFGHREQRHGARRALTFLARRPLGCLAAGSLVFLTLVSTFAPLLATQDPVEYDYTVRLQGPSTQHWFGTDDYGRDVYSRIVFGGRISLGLALTSMALASIVGCVGGVLSGYIGGWFDTLVQRGVEVFLSFPTIILALLLVATFGAGLDKIVLALGIVFIPRVVRLIRGSALVAKVNVWVEAARSIGASHKRIMFVHVLPTVLPPLIVFVSITSGSVVLVEATLSFLGLGVPPPTPSWGAMLSGSSKQYMVAAPWLAIFPGMAITLTVLAFNLLGDAVRDYLDPKLRD